MRRTFAIGLILLLLPAVASAQSVRERTTERCLAVASEAECAAAIDLLWPILTELSLEPGESLLRATGKGTMSTPSFTVTSPSIKVAWTVDATSASFGCSFVLELLPVTPPPADGFYAPPWGLGGGLLSTSVEAGDKASGVGFAHGVTLDEYFLRQSGLGECNWTVKVTTD